MNTRMSSGNKGSTFSGDRMNLAVFTLLAGWMAAAPAGPLLVTVEDDAGRLDAGALRTAISQELHRPVAAPSDADAVTCEELLLVSVAADGSATVLFRRTAEPRRQLRRTVKLSANPQERMAELVLLAGNLARNEAEELTPKLPPPSPPPLQVVAADPAPVAATVTESAPSPVVVVNDSQVPSPWALTTSYGIGTSRAPLHLFEVGAARWWTWMMVGLSFQAEVGDAQGVPVRRYSPSFEARFHRRVGPVRLSGGMGIGVVLHLAPPTYQGEPARLVPELQNRAFAAVSVPLRNVELYLQPEVTLPTDLSLSHFGVALGARFWVFG